MMHHNRPECLPILKEASLSLWSGRLIFSTKSEQIGTIVINNGKIAWSVCCYQPENLGTFLLRQGNINKKQLDLAKTMFSKKKDQRKLGTFLEDEGFIARPVLRKCLLQHNRMAIACLIRNNNLNIASEVCKLEPEDDFEFAVEDVLSKDFILPLSPGNVLLSIPELKSFASLDGFKFVLISDNCGRIVASYSKEEQAFCSELPFKILDMMERSARISELASIGKVSWLISDCSEGIMIMTSLDSSGDMLISLVLSGKPNIGMAKYRLSSMLEDIRTRMNLNNKK